MGIGMEPSHQRERVAKVISEHGRKIELALADQSRVFMLIFDDFNGHWRQATPSEKKSFGTGATVGNAMLKDITQSRLVLKVSGVGEQMLPSNISSHGAIAFLENMWTARNLDFYLATRRADIAAASAIVVPYGGVSHASEGVALGLESAMLLRSFSDGYKTKEQMMKVFRQSADLCNELLKDNYVLVTGDWYTFRYLLEAVYKEPAVFGHLVPLPGQFHIGLNAQEALFFRSES
jgi:hypothetical protein